jgi:hypothetical protein
MNGTVKYASKANTAYLGKVGVITSLAESTSLEAAIDFGPDFKAKGLPLQVVEIKVRHLAEAEEIEKFWAEGQEEQRRVFEQEFLLRQLNLAISKHGLPLEKTLTQIATDYSLDQIREIRQFVHQAGDLLQLKKGQYVLAFQGK